MHRAVLLQFFQPLLFLLCLKYVENKLSSRQYVQQCFLIKYWQYHDTIRNKNQGSISIAHLLHI